MDNIYGIILAAGASTRMKTQKMLLPYEGSTIVETVIRKAQHFLNQNIVVVIGSDREQIIEKTYNLNLIYAVNENYAHGMLSSVICGFGALPAKADAALIFLGDQPQLPVQVIGLIIETWQNSKKGIIIPTFMGHRGHPVLIETKYTGRISALNPEKGLRQLMDECSNEIMEIECTFPEILKDLDNPEEYENAIK